MNLSFEYTCTYCRERDFRVTWVTDPPQHLVTCMNCKGISLLPADGPHRDTWNLPEAVWDALKAEENNSNEESA